MFQLFFVGFTSGCLITFVSQWVWKNMKCNGRVKETPKVEASKEILAVDNPYKLVLIVNKDLKMGDGKVVAQCSHAAVGTYESYHKTHRQHFDAWEKQGKRVSIYKVADAHSLKLLYESADSRGMITCLVRDAGLTQIAAGSKTVLAIGPERESVLHSITEFLQPYS